MTFNDQDRGDYSAWRYGLTKQETMLHIYPAHSEGSTFVQSLCGQVITDLNRAHRIGQRWCTVCLREAVTPVADPSPEWPLLP